MSKFELYNSNNLVRPSDTSLSHLNYYIYINVYIYIDFVCLSKNVLHLCNIPLILVFIGDIIRFLSWQYILVSCKKTKKSNVIRLLVFTRWNGIQAFDN